MTLWSRLKTCLRRKLVGAPCTAGADMSCIVLTSPQTRWFLRIARGLKPTFDSPLTGRLKPCPDTNLSSLQSLVLLLLALLAGQPRRLSPHEPSCRPLLNHFKLTAELLVALAMPRNLVRASLRDRPSRCSVRGRRAGCRRFRTCLAWLR